MKAFLALASFFVPGVLIATTFIIKTEEQKILEANRICAVKVLSLKTQQANGIISTVGRVRPIDCFKNPTQSDFDIVWPGGSFEKKDSSGKSIRYKTSVPGTPDLKINQTAVLYLSKSKNADTYMVYGWTQGVTPIFWDQDSQQYLLGKPQSSAKRQKSNTTEMSRDLKAEQSQSLDQFREHIESVLKSKGR